MNNPNFKELVRLNIQTLTSFPYIEQDFDALTNYELLCKVVNELNSVIENQNITNQSVIEMYQAFNTLKNYVDTYFENLDVQEEINNKLDEMASDGTLTDLISRYIDPLFNEYKSEINVNITTQNIKISQQDNKIDELEVKVDAATSGSPLAASSVEDMTDTDRIYVNTTDGYWYYYDGDSWEQGGVYQSSVSSSDIEELELNKVSKNSGNNLFNPLTNVSGYIKSDGTIGAAPYITTDFIHLNENDVLTVDSPVRYIGLYDTSKVFDSYIISSANFGYSYTATSECYVRVSVQDFFTYTNIYINDNNDEMSYVSLGIENDIKLSSFNKGEVNKLIGDAVGNAYTNVTLNFTPDYWYDYLPNELVSSVNDGYVCLNVKGGEIYNISGYSYKRKSLFVFVDKNNKRLPYPFYGFDDNTQEHTDVKFMIPSDGLLYINKIGNRAVSCSKVTPLKTSQESINVLSGKKYVACGDSFTEGAYSHSTTNNYLFTDGIYAGLNKVYPRFIALRNNMNLVMDAISGSTMTYIPGRDNCFSEEGGRYTQIPSDAEYITLKFGINDGADHQDAPIGNITDNTNTTYYGAWNIVMNYLIRNHPNAKIGIIITNGATRDIAEATINIAKKWGVAYLNEALGEDVPLMLRSNRLDVDQSIKNFRNNYWYVNSSTETPNHHPNELCHEYESTIVENFLRSL